jgi:hypothetical protein
MSSKCEQAIAFYAHLRQIIDLVRHVKLSTVRAEFDGIYVETWRTNDGWSYVREEYSVLRQVTDPDGNKYEVKVLEDDTIITDADGNVYTFLGR